MSGEVNGMAQTQLITVDPSMEAIAIINALSRTQVIMVEQPSPSVAVINAGPLGPPGPVGPSGGAYVSANWAYDTEVVSPPDPGTIRTNTPETTMWIHELDEVGISRADGISQIVVDDLIRVKSGDGTTAIARVTAAPTDNGAYWTVPIDLESGVIDTKKGTLIELQLVLSPPQGEPGEGVPPGGTFGQVLTKQSATDYDSDWETAVVSLPTGGTTGQLLVKQSSTDNDANWQDHKGVYVCTSTTRPTHVDGRHIYETDTKLHYFSDGGQWYLKGEQVIGRAVLSGGGASNIVVPVPSSIQNPWRLRIEWRVRCSGNGDLALRFNGDTTASYQRQYTYGSGGSTVSGVQTTTSLAVGSSYGLAGNGWAIGDGMIPDFYNSGAAIPKAYQGISYDPRDLSGTLLVTTGGYWSGVVTPSRIENVTLFVNTGVLIAGSSLTCYARSAVG